MKRLKLLIGMLLAACLFVAGMFAGCAQEEPEGEFHSVREAYESGLLTKEDVMSIAYYHNGGRSGNEAVMSEGYEPQEKGELDEGVALKIRQSAAYDYRSKGLDDEAETDGFTIIEYCGTYGNCVAVMMENIYGGFSEALGVQEIDGIKIYYNSGNRMKIWTGILLPGKCS